MRRRVLDTRTVSGLILTGIVAGALSAAAILAGQIVWGLRTARRAQPAPGSPPAIPAPPRAPPLELAAAYADLRARNLGFPVEGASPKDLMDSFLDPRAEHLHHAVDILAARHSRVRAVDDGSIARLTASAAGGISIYQFDPAQRFCFYYAHLEGYAPGLKEGQKVGRGDVIGYVGTSGNAPRETPHLHFAIFRLDDPETWWTGTAINPYTLLR